MRFTKPGHADTNRYRHATYGHRSGAKLGRWVRALATHRSNQKAPLVSPIALSIIILLMARVVLAGTEIVRVKEVVDDDTVIIERTNGQTYFVEKGIGCLSLWRYEGKHIIIVSPGTFLGLGSRIILSELGQECRIWSSRLIDVSAKTIPMPPSAKLAPDQLQIEEKSIFVEALQKALKYVGYDPGPIDGILGAKTIRAFHNYAASKGLPLSKEGIDMALYSLASDILELGPGHPEAAEILRISYILEAAAQSGTEASRQSPLPLSPPACESGHWVQSVMENGALVVLEDGSVWEVDTLDTIDTTLWLPTEDITLCDEKMINSDTGDVVSVQRLK